jgi:uncharacterized protein YqgV (UPF0045/DUF77 family)
VIWRAEFLIEPFEEGNPGPHVTQAVEAMKRRGIEVEVTAFGNVARGGVEELTDAVATMIQEAVAAGAGRVSLQLSEEQDQSAGFHVGGLHGALAGMIAQVEAELGAGLAELPRHQKQAAIRILDQRGAFLLRKAIEDVADAMGVSRITIYNYLNALR